MDGCLLSGSRVIVPSPGQQVVLQELHSICTTWNVQNEVIGKADCVVARFGEGYIWFVHVMSVNLTKQICLLLHSTHGVGHQDPGLDSILITLVHFKIIISL